MKRTLLFSVLGLALCMTACNQAQDPAEAAKIARTLKSTEVLEEGKIAFRVYAPKADEVTMSGDLAERIPAQMTRNADGVWEVVMEGVEPGVYRYNFNIDGVKTIDPRSAQAIETYSLVNYAPTGDEFFALKDIPHGALTQRYYHSESAGTVRRCHLWTPAGFEKMKAKLPVFYLVHGGGDNDKGWPLLGAAAEILDNLYAEGKLAPMMVVMPDGHIDSNVFVDDLCNDLIPFIESTYNVYTDASHRALGGLSNGGIQTMNVIMKNHEMFDSYLILSSGWHANNEDAFNANVARINEIVDEFNSHVDMLIFTQGGPEDIAYQNGLKTLKAFQDAGYKCEFFDGPGAHTWYTWRYNLRDLAPRLFK